jgi:hypothetical protein
MGTSEERENERASPFSYPVLTVVTGLPPWTMRITLDSVQNDGVGVMYTFNRIL